MAKKQIKWFTGLKHTKNRFKALPTWKSFLKGGGENETNIEEFSGGILFGKIVSQKTNAWGWEGRIRGNSGIFR